MVIAWRLYRLMQLGRTLSDLLADLLFESDEWRVASDVYPEQKARDPPDFHA